MVKCVRDVDAPYMETLDVFPTYVLLVQMKRQKQRKMNNMDKDGLIRLLKERESEIRGVINYPYQDSSVIKEAEEKLEYIEKLIWALGGTW